MYATSCSNFISTSQPRETAPLARLRRHDFTPDEVKRLIARGVELLREQPDNDKSEIRMRHQLGKEHGVSLTRDGAVSPEWLTLVAVEVASGMRYERGRLSDERGRARRRWP
jgi:hypothetical protein